MKINKIRVMEKCKCSACKNPKKKLPHPVQTCECKKCRNTRYEKDLEVYTSIYHGKRCQCVVETENCQLCKTGRYQLTGIDRAFDTPHLSAINDEGMQVPLSPSGSNKHGGPVTTSSAVTAYLDDFEKVLQQVPIDGEDYYGFEKINSSLSIRNSNIKTFWDKFCSWLETPSPI